MMELSKVSRLCENLEEDPSQVTNMRAQRVSPLFLVSGHEALILKALLRLKEVTDICLSCCKPWGQDSGEISIDSPALVAECAAAPITCLLHECLRALFSVIIPT